MVCSEARFELIELIVLYSIGIRLFEFLGSLFFGNNLLSKYFFLR
jgi:hypothetical protein